jgi:hypothetical protein
VSFLDRGILKVLTLHINHYRLQAGMCRHGANRTIVTGNRGNTRVYVAGILAVALTLGACAHGTARPQSYKFGKKNLSIDQCVVHLVTSAASYRSPNQLEFSVDVPEDTLFVEHPLELGLRVERADATDGPERTLVRRSGDDMWACPSPISEVDWMWSFVAEPAPQGELQDIPPGRFRVVMRYLPGSGFDGASVCVTTSSTFEVREPGVILTIVD